MHRDYRALESRYEGAEKPRPTCYLSWEHAIGGLLPQRIQCLMHPDVHRARGRNRDRRSYQKDNLTEGIHLGTNQTRPARVETLLRKIPTLTVVPFYETQIAPAARSRSRYVLGD